MKAFSQSVLRTLGVFRKSLREIWRDWLTLSLTLVFAPFFVFAYYLFTAGGSTAYSVAIVNEDEGAILTNGEQVILGEELVAALGQVSYAAGQPILRLKPVADREAAEDLLRERGALVFIAIPPDFSRSVLAAQAGDHTASITISFGGDLTNPYYTVASMLALTGTESYLQQATGQPPLVQYIEEPLGVSAARTEFELYVPGVLIFAIMMLVFLASMMVAREAEAGTLRRLRLTRLRACELLGGMSVALVLVGLAAELLAYLTAIACGFRSQGPLWLALLVGVLTSLAIIGSGLVVAAFSRTVSQAFIIANFPLGLFMFFSGAIFPIPKTVLFTVAGRAISLYDLLPTTHAVEALNKVFTLGAGVGDVTYELGALATLTLLYFAVGAWLFQKMQLD